MSKLTKILIITAVVVLLAFGALIYEKDLNPSAPVVPVATGPDTVLGMISTSVPANTTSTNYGNVFIGRLQDDLGTTTTLTLRGSTDGKTTLLFMGSQQLSALPWSSAIKRRSVILGQIGKYVYVGQFPESYDGYEVFTTGAFQVAQVYIVDGTTKVLTGTADEFIYSLQQHSTGQIVMALLDYNHHQLHLLSSDKTLDTIVPLPQTFTQFGDMYFSADGTKLALAAAFGIPGAERGAAFILSLKNPILSEAGETVKRDSYMHVAGWKGSNALDMSEKPSPLLNAF